MEIGGIFAAISIDQCVLGVSSRVALTTSGGHGKQLRRRSMVVILIRFSLLREASSTKSRYCSQIVLSMRSVPLSTSCGRAGGKHARGQLRLCMRILDKHL
jgi:hypothetical protein